MYMYGIWSAGYKKNISQGSAKGQPCAKGTLQYIVHCRSNSTKEPHDIAVQLEHVLCNGESNIAQESIGACCIPFFAACSSSFYTPAAA